MIIRSTLLPSVLLALAAAQKSSDTTVGLQTGLRSSKAKPVAETNVEGMRSEEFKGFWRSLQSEMSMSIEVPSPEPSQSMPLESAPVSPINPVAAPAEEVPSQPTSPIAAPVEAAPSQPSPISVPTVSPVLTTISDFPSLAPSRSLPSNIVEEQPSFLGSIPPNDQSDIPSDMPSDMTSDAPSLVV